MMSVSGRPAPLQDEFHSNQVLRCQRVFEGSIWDVRREQVDLGAAGHVTRDYVHHPGAVGILAMNDDGDILLLRQYRHPVRSFLWELPAGLLDVAGESPWVAAERELAEEADLRAARWSTLIDSYNSPGGSDEVVRIYLARDLSEVPEAERHQRTGEELDMQVRWVPLQEAVEAVMAGRLHNPTAVTGILAAAAAKASEWTTLRPHNAAWPEHHAFR